MTSLTTVSLFGGDLPWSPLDWTSSDDRVRGGSSRSELICNPFTPIAIFQGNLDIETLGGAGFASQRTTGEDRNWDLSAYDGMLLKIAKADGKKYTLTLKDGLLPKSPDGREQSTISWEYDFKPDEAGEDVFVRWDDLKATYRGREKKDAKPLDPKHIKRVSVMMRSFFGTQQGDFSLSIRSILAFSKNSTFTPYQDEPETTRASISRSSDNLNGSITGHGQGWLGWLSRICNLH